MQVARGLLKGFLVGSLKFSESSQKTYHTVSHSFLISAIRLSFWFAWNEKKWLKREIQLQRW